LNRAWEKIIPAMGFHVPIDLRPEIGEGTAHGGVLSRRDHRRTGPTVYCPGEIYPTVDNTGVRYTTETPKAFPIQARVKAETLLNAWKGCPP
jgi:hypothetical protein